MLCISGIDKEVRSYMNDANVNRYKEKRNKFRIIVGALAFVNGIIKWLLNKLGYKIPSE